MPVGGRLLPVGPRAPPTCLQPMIWLAAMPADWGLGFRVQDVGYRVFRVKGKGCAFALRGLVCGLIRMYYFPRLRSHRWGKNTVSRSVTVRAWPGLWPGPVQSGTGTTPSPGLDGAWARMNRMQPGWLDGLGAAPMDGAQPGKRPPPRRRSRAPPWDGSADTSGWGGEGRDGSCLDTRRRQ